MVESSTSEPADYFQPSTVFLRVQYPDSIGPVCKETLSDLLKAISSDKTVNTTKYRHAMTLYQWSLGARVSGKPCCSDLELSKQEDTQQLIPLIVPDGEPYFCESQPASPPAGMIIDPSQYVTQPNTPTVLVEMWHNIPDEAVKQVIDRICYHVQYKLTPATDSAAAGMKTWVYVMQYTLESSGTSKNGSKGFMCTS